MIYKNKKSVYYINLTKVFAFFALGILALSGVVIGLKALNQYFKTAKAENIQSSVSIFNDANVQLVLSPDQNFVYSTSKIPFSSNYSIDKYDNSNDTKIASLTTNGNFGLLQNPNGSKIYAFSNNEIKIIDTATFTQSGSISIAVSKMGFFNPAGTKLYVPGNYELKVIDLSTDTIEATVSTIIEIPAIGDISAYTISNLGVTGAYTFSPDGNTIYFDTGLIFNTQTNTFSTSILPIENSLADPFLPISEDGTKIFTSNFSIKGFRIIDTQTKKLVKIIQNDVAPVRIITQNGKIYVLYNDNNLKIYDAKSYEILATRQIINSNSSICSSGCTLTLTPDASRLYISGGTGGSVTYIGATSNNNVIIVPPTFILFSIDLNSLDISDTQGFSSAPRVETFSTNGKTIYATDTTSYKKIDSEMVNSSDISSFNCSSGTNTLSSSVTCTVNTNSNVRGLAKFSIGTETCTAHFASSGSNTATCTYIANNIQSSSITITPSFGSPLTSGNLTITGGSNDTTITGSNIVANNNCTTSGNVRIGSVFDCSFSLSGSSSNSYILPSNGIKIGINTVSSKSDNCTISQNGTANAKLDCKNIPSIGGSVGNQNAQAFVNNSTTGNNVGSINLTDGFLVNSTTDTVDVMPGDGYCSDINGQCTLRAAVMEANSDYIKDKITIPAGIYQLTILPTDNHNLTENKGAIDGDLDVTTDIDFVGAGKDVTFIQAGTDATNGIDRVFHIFNTNVNMNDLTVRYGRISNTNFIFNSTNTVLPANGGGIYYQKFNDFDAYPENALDVVGYNYNDVDTYGGPKEFKTSLNLLNVAVNDNYAQNSGGGVYNAATTSSFTNSEFKNNKSEAYGGGISRAYFKDRNLTQTWNNNTIKIIPITTYNSFNARSIENANFELKNSIISQNQSADGGGLYHDRAKKIIIDENSQITSNVATNRGGGIYNSELIGFQGVSTITITGATINSNKADQGGAIYNESGHVETLPGNLTQKPTTIQYNSANKGSAWFALTGLNDLTNTNVWENNTQNQDYDYNTARPISVIRIYSGDLNINKSMLLSNWGRVIEVDGGNVNVDSTTIHANNGRAISGSNGSAAPTNPSNIQVVNSTITYNNGTGIYLGDTKPGFSAKHVTIANNNFGLIIDPQNTPSMQIYNTLIVNSVTKNCSDTSTNSLNSGNYSAGNSNMSNNSDCDVFSGFTNNSNAGNFLGNVQYNDGPTITMALLAGSPAIDSGGCTGICSYPQVTVDQRGFPRPNGSAPDIGAFEAQLSLAAVDDTATTNSDTGVSLNVLTNDIPGPNGIDTGSVNIVDQPTKGSLSDDGNGNFTYTPDSGQFSSTATDTFTYYVFDNNGNQSNTATVTITVNVAVVNNSPVANDDGGSGDKNNPIDINVPSNDTDSDGSLDLTSVVIVNNPTKGNVSVNPTSGVVTYTPTPSSYTSSGSDTFTYKIKDNTGDFSNIATVTINITVVLPIANNDTVSLNPNSSINIDVLTNDTNATSICVGSVLGVTNGTAVISGTSIVYTPTVGYTGTDSFTYKACNSDGQSNSATVSVTVNNTAPTAVNDSITLPAYGVAVVDVSSNDTDPQGNNTLDKSTIVVTTQPTKGTVGVNTTANSPDFGKVTYTPNANPNTVFSSPFSDTFSYTIKDTGNPALVSNVATVTVFYTPVASNDTVSTNQGTPVIISVLSNDLASDTICDSGNNIFTNPAKGTLVLSTDKKSFTYTPTGTNTGSDSFTYKTCNPNGSSSFATANITINPNQPQANPDSITTNESTPVVIPVLSNDTNATNICVGSINLGSNSTNGTAVITTTGSGNTAVDKITFTPTIGYFGTTTFTYTACSTVAGTNPSSPATVTVTVTQVNPIAVNDTATTNQGVPITIAVLSNDSDPSGQTLTICTPLSTPSNGTITKTTTGSGNTAVDKIVFTPNTGYSGTATFTYTACDPGGHPSNVATVSVTVIPNSAPVANPDTASTAGSTPITINVPNNDTDSDGSLDLTSVTIVTNPTKGNTSVNPTTGIVTYTPTTASFTTDGSDTFTYKIKDNTGNFSNTTTVTINVTVNPIANPDNASTTVPTPVTINVPSNDTKTSADLNLSSVTIVAQPTKGTVSVNTTANSPDLGKVTYTPTASSYTASGSDSFTYYIKDTEGHTSNTTTVTIAVVLPGSNLPPVANADTATGNKNTPITINVPSNDTDSDGSLDLTSVTIVTSPTKGTVSVNTTANSPDLGKVTYTPTANQFTNTSTDTFTYKIKDNKGTYSNIATVTINIVLALPTAINDTTTTDQNKAIAVDVLLNDILATNICTNSVQVNTTNGTTTTTNNKIIYTPKTDFTGTDSFTYKACNADGESTPATVTIAVKQLPQPVVTQAIELKLYKDKPSTDVVINQPVQVQADIRNPNNFTVDKIETIITIDTSKVQFVIDSAKQGTINGTKYSNLEKIFDLSQGSNNLSNQTNLFDILRLGSTKVNAATNTTLEFISDSQLKVTSYNVAPGETIPVVFNVIPKQNIQNSITGKSDIINPATNQSIAQAQAQTDLNPVQITPILVRTGGEIIWIGLSLITLIGAIAFGPRLLKRFKVDLKR